jgi:hypothetical protein
MLVYGDPQHRELLSRSLLRLRRCGVGPTQAAGGERLEETRAALIFAGQLEQAVLDDPGASEWDDGCELRAELARLMAHAADRFVASWAELHEPGWREALAAARSHADGWARSLARLESLRDRTLTLKTPEGFAFYALYPEQFVEAALSWMQAHPDARAEATLVVGIRSIGTTLAAVVAAVLAARGWEARSLTVRPHGHPFERRLELERSLLPRARWALVVDEGPGLSGSSMAAVAEALERVGFRAGAISFLPSHAGSPGGAASAAIRARWSQTDRYVVPLEQTRLCRGRLAESLCAMLPDAAGDDLDPSMVEDLSAGAWRRVCYADAHSWPAVCTIFERSKYRIRTRSGMSYLLKFSGLCAAPAGERSLYQEYAAQLQQRAATGHAVAPAVMTQGFVVTPWIEARPRSARFRGTTLCRHIGSYLAAASGPPLCSEEQEAAILRLRSMLHVNAREILGEQAGGQVARRADALLVRLPRQPRAYGDGHLQPHEWLVTPSGVTLKADCIGHDVDHSLIGRQAIQWDLAAAMVEWRLGGSSIRALLDAYHENGGEPFPTAALMFYRLAYLAFRIGQLELCASEASELHERARLRRASLALRAQLAV